MATKNRRYKTGESRGKNAGRMPVLRVANGLGSMSSSEARLRWEVFHLTFRTLRKLGCGTRRNKALGWLCEMASALGEK